MKFRKGKWQAKMMSVMCNVREHCCFLTALKIRIFRDEGRIDIVGFEIYYYNNRNVRRNVFVA